MNNRAFVVILIVALALVLAALAFHAPGGRDLMRSFHGGR